MNPAMLLNPKAYAKEQAKAKKKAEKNGTCGSVTFSSFRLQLCFTLVSPSHAGGFQVAHDKICPQ
jgi:hypothetical protein